MRIDFFTASDWPAIRDIYLEGIATGDATFQQTAPEWPQWDEAHLPHSRLAVRDKAGVVVGWAGLSPVSKRSVYAGVAEVSIYVAARFREQGIGRTLLHGLIEHSEQAGIWTLQAGIFPENAASIDLHSKCGFRIVGVRSKLGRRDGKWRDVVLMERRSPVIGV